jgi:hypothetical protein
MPSRSKLFSSVENRENSNSAHALVPVNAQAKDRSKPIDKNSVYRRSPLTSRGRIRSPAAMSGGYVVSAVRCYVNQQAVGNSIHQRITFAARVFPTLDTFALFPPATTGQGVYGFIENKNHGRHSTHPTVQYRSA